MLRPASCASPITASFSPIGSRSSRRSSLTLTVRQHGRWRALCCSTTYPSSCGPLIATVGGCRRAGSPSTSSAAWASTLADRGSGWHRRSRAPSLATGGHSLDPCRVIPRGSSATPTAACWPRSQSAGRRPSCSSANGICSTHSIVCWPTRPGTIPKRSSSSYAAAPSKLSPAPPRGSGSGMRPGRLATRASIAGSPSTPR